MFWKCTVALPRKYWGKWKKARSIEINNQKVIDVRGEDNENNF